MNDLTTFTNPQFGNLRTVILNDEPWFVASDVCKALGISNSKDAIKRLDSDEKSGVDLTDPHGRIQRTNCVSESGLYSLILGSRKPSARQFKRWVTHDVIPSIRKTGAYVSPSLAQQIISDPDSLILILNQLRDEHSARISAEQSAQTLTTELASLRKRLDSIPHTVPLVFQNDHSADGCCSIGELAKSLSVNGHKLSRNALFSYFRHRGYIQQNSPLPTSRAIESGYFKIMEKRSGSSHYYTTVITLAGQLFFTAAVI